MSLIRSCGLQLRTSAANLYRALPRDYRTLAEAHKKKAALIRAAGVRGLTRDMLETASACVKTGIDLVTFIVPKIVKTKPGSFAFLVHPRDITDIWRCYPAFKYLPDALVMEIANYLPPRTISPISGVFLAKTGEELTGYLMAAFVAPKHIIENPALAAMRVVFTAMLARKKGISFIGLGALIPFLTKYGDLIKKHVEEIGVTTGHAYTSHCISETTLRVINDIGSSPAQELIAVIGAAGSTGSASISTLAYSGARKFLLIDQERKRERLKELKKGLHERCPDIEVALSTDNADISRSRVIVTVTNAPESIIEESWIRPGMIFIDDAQPPNVSKELDDKRDDILVIKVLVRIPGLDPHFDFGLGTSPDITFTCLGELALLASAGWYGDHTIGYAKHSQVQRTAELSSRTRIGIPSPFYGYEGKEISPEMIRQVGSLWRGQNKI